MIIIVMRQKKSQRHFMLPRLEFHFEIQSLVIAKKAWHLKQIASGAWLVRCHESTAICQHCFTFPACLCLSQRNLGKCRSFIFFEFVTAMRWATQHCSDLSNTQLHREQRDTSFGFYLKNVNFMYPIWPLTCVDRCGSHLMHVASLPIVILKCYTEDVIQSHSELERILYFI